ncbi:MAG TPA: signal peptidase [Burkholderiales bacterium]
MKRLVCIAVAAAFAFASSAGAQPAKPAAPKPAPEAQKPATEVQKPGKKPAAAAHKSRRNEDARACLERASNTEIIKCAEAYL